MHVQTDNKRACDDSVEDVSTKQARTTETADSTARSRRNWTSQEDELLKNAVKIFGGRNWRDISTLVPGRDWLQCNQRWSKTLRPGLRKGNWSPEEDEQLLALLGESHDWQFISARIEGRSPKQCRERWSMNLDPSINRGPWAKEEDERLMELSEHHNRKWAAIAREMPGRTESHVKTRMQTLMRRQAKERGWTTEQDKRLMDLITTHGRDCDAFLSEFPGQTRATLLRRFRLIVGDNSSVMIKALAVDNKNKKKKKKVPSTASTSAASASTQDVRTSTPTISGGLMRTQHQQQHQVQNIHQKLYQPRPYFQQQQHMQHPHHMLPVSSLPRMDSGGMMLDIDTILNPTVGTWGTTPSPSVHTSTATSGIHSGFSPASSAASAMSTVTSSPSPWGPNNTTVRGFTPAAFNEDFVSQVPLAGDGQQHRPNSRGFTSVFHDDYLHVPLVDNVDVTNTRQQYFGPPIVRGQMFGGGDQAAQQREHTWHMNNPGELTWHQSNGSQNVAMTQDIMEDFISSRMSENVRQAQMRRDVSPAPVLLSRIRQSVAAAQQGKVEPSSF